MSLTNGTAKATSEALKTWGVLAIIPFFLVGVYFYLEGEREREVASAIRRDAREAKLVVLLERQHTSIIQITAERMAAMDKKLSRLDERGNAWEPTLKEMAQYMREMRKTAKEIQEAQ